MIKKWLKFLNLVPDLESPNQFFETWFDDILKFQPFGWINGSVQLGSLFGKN